MRHFARTVFAAATIAAMSVSGPALAFGPAGVGKPLGARLEQLRMTGGGHAVAPFAHVVFCVRQPRDCRATGNARNAVITPAMVNQLHAVNSSVNSRIIPADDDPDEMGGDVWSLDPQQGDCDDYAVTKRHELLRLGWPSGALRLAEATTASGEGHLVLIASTPQGDVVLDNRSEQIVPWRRAGLHWLLVQSQDDPRVWLHM